MPYRQRLVPSSTQNPQELLAIWRQERAFRVGKALCYAGLLLSVIATIADFFWSDDLVFITDILLLLGCALSLYWIRSASRPTYYWVPLFLSFWISALPSFWTTGGLNSPFFGVGLAAVYVMGAIMDGKDRSIFYMLFAVLHIPVFFAVETFHPLFSDPTLPLEFTSIISSVLLLTIFVCVHSLLRTERELSLEFAEYFGNLGKTEEDLKKRERQLREAQAIASIGSWEWDLDADLIAWSDELFKIFEVEKETFDPSFSAYLGRLNPEMRERINAIIQNSMKTGEDFVFENRIQTKQGERFIFSRGRVVKDNNGRTSKMMGTCQDVTDRKSIESQLREAQNELEKRVEERTLQLAQSLERETVAKEIAENASQAKMQFLANMSHEIRTPINSILGFSELIVSEDHSEDEAKEYLTHVRENGKQLLHLIDDILDLSKFEAGRIPIQRAAFSLQGSVESIVNSFLPALKNKGLELSLSFQEGLWPFVFSDADRLGQVLTNLISNSIKFSEKGSIRISVSHRPVEGTNRAYVTFDIVDSGIGISAENQKRLFLPFSQGDGSIARKFGGSGLGLALSKRIADALGGSLELKRSAPGEGSCFSFRVPVERAVQKLVEKQEAKVAPSFTNERFRNKKILLVEDSTDNAILICHYLKTLGATIDVATDGLQAVNVFRQQPYHCILMDIQMPGMDGLEATRKIRELGYTNPIIALTAHALPAEAERSLQAGCNLHLTKPISKAVLIRSLGEQLGPSAPPLANEL